MDSELNRDDFFMQAAISQAQQALEVGEVPIGAVVVFNGRIIGKGYNMVETLCDATAHAEMQAITAAATTLGNKYLDKCTLYVTVEPCVMCGGALAWSQIGRVVYGASDPKRGYTSISKSIMHPKTEVCAGVKKEECSMLVENFFKNLRK